MSILRQRYKAPKITFDFDEVVKTVSIGTPVNVWNNTNYNSNYSVTILTIVPNVRTNNNKFIVTPTAIGEYEIQIMSSNKGRTIEVKSNMIKLIVE